MHSKVVVVVSRTHWRCLTCKVLNKRAVSVDQHLESVHPRFDPLSPKSSAGNAAMCCYSDGEMDTQFQSKHLLPSPSSAFPIPDLCLKGPDSSKGRSGPKGSPPNQTGVGKKKRVSVRKLPQKRGTARKKDIADEDDDSEICFIPAVDIHNQAVKVELSSKPRTSQRLRRKLGVANTDLNCAKSKGPRERKSSVEGITFKKSLKLSPTPAVELQNVPNKRIDKKSNKPSKKKGVQDSADSTTSIKKGNHSESDLETQVRDDSPLQAAAPADQLVSKRDQSPSSKAHQNIKRQKKTDLSKNTVKVPPHIDKSNIATSCAPWLLDVGRKAGEKVTKKARRAMPPEEKQAVRELYGIPQPQQHARMPAVTPPNARYMSENQASSNFGLSSSHHPSGFSQPLARGDVSQHTLSNYTNNFSVGSRDTFMEGSNTQETLYTGYLYSQQHHDYPHNPTMPHVAAEFYPQAVNVTAQQSNAMSFPGYSQDSSTVLSATPGSDTGRHQVESGGYLGQSYGNSDSSALHSQSVPTSLSVAARPLAHSMQAAANNNIVQPDYVPSVHSMQNITSSNVNINFDQTHSMQNAVDKSIKLDQTPNPHRVPSVIDNNIEIDPSKQKKALSAPTSQPKESAAAADNTAGGSNKCQVCQEEFPSAARYEQHQREVTRFEVIECKRCGVRFHGLHELNLHVFAAHETEQRGFCFDCDRDAAGLEDLEKHVHRHAYAGEVAARDLRHHDCRLCGEELPNRYASIHRHYHQYHAALVCSHCHHSVTDLQAYKDHHHQAHTDQPISCSVCGLQCAGMGGLDAHQPCGEDVWGEDGKGEACAKCGRWCPNRAVVEAHRRQHRSQDDVEAYRQGAKVGFPCASCEKVFKNKHACRRHAKMVHEGVSCYKHYCEYCGKGFLTKGHMRDHIALHHLGIQRYACDYCPLKFVCGPTLRRHVRTEHTKHKPYACPHCPLRFFEKTPLQRHLTVHTGLAPLMCEHCGKGFYTKHSFRNHTSTHSSVKDFVCGGCQKGFTRKYNLSAHQKVCKSL